MVFARPAGNLPPAHCGLTRSMNNNDAGYVNYETIIYSVGRVGYCIEAHRA